LTWTWDMGTSISTYFLIDSRNRFFTPKHDYKYQLWTFVDTVAKGLSFVNLWGGWVF
jgi:hypothetical protein